MDELENGVDIQETAEPEQEVTDTEVSEEPQEEQAEATAEPAEEPSEPEIPDSVWAAARRRAEADAQKRADAEVARRCAGKTNPLTGKPITTQKEYWEAIDAQNQMRRDAAFKQAVKGLSPQDAAALEQVLKNDPEKQRMQRQIDEMKAVQDRDLAMQALNADVAEIGKLDPNIKSIDDVLKLPNVNAMIDKVRRGYSLVDAYRLLNYDSSMKASQNAGKQAARNEVRGKTHLAAHGGGSNGNGGKTIPASMLPSLKEQFPGKSIEELTKLYNDVM